MFVLQIMLMHGVAYLHVFVIVHGDKLAVLNRIIRV